MPSNLFVVLMGVGTVFIGLICIIILCTIMSSIYKAVTGKKDKPATTVSPAAAPAPVVSQEIPNRPAFIAAVSAAIAEELGTDVSGIRIHSVKRV